MVGSISNFLLNIILTVANLNQIIADGSENLSLFDTNASTNTTVPIGSQTNAIAFFRGLECSVGDADSMGTTSGMPCKWTDHAFLATTNTGIVHIPFSDLAHAPSGAPEAIFGQTDISGCGTNACISPVSLAFDLNGRIITASDRTNEVWVIKRKYNPDAGKILTDKANAADAAAEAADAAAEAASEDPNEAEAEAEIPKDTSATDGAEGAMAQALKEDAVEKSPAEIDQEPPAV